MSTAGAPARERLGAPEKAAALGVLAFAMLIVSLHQYIVVVALPEIGQGLGFTGQILQGVISAYALTSAGFLLLGGRAADVLFPPRWRGRRSTSRRRPRRWPRCRASSVPGCCAGSSAPRPPAGWPTSCMARRAWSPIICARWKRPVSSPAGRHVRAARTERGDELVALYEGD